MTLNMVLRRMLILSACITTASMSCSKQFASPTGTLTSPNYPQNYPPNQDCTTTITGPENTRLILSFVDFSVEYSVPCENDYVQIFGVTDAIDARQYCGLYNPWHWISRSNNVTIHFHSDGVNEHEYRGLKLQWRTEDQFSYHTTPMTWTDAMATCAAADAILIRNDDITKAQINLLENRPNFTESWTSEYLTPWVWFKGCLRVVPNMTIGTPVRLKNNRMTVCQSHCSSSNYFALQSDQCYCLKDFQGEFVRPEENCNADCPNSREKCGGTETTYTVYMNDLCMDNSSNWTGTVAQSIGGRQCDAWSSHYSDSNDALFPDGSVSNASNYCRNPDNDKALWCFHGNDMYYCDVPRCFARDIPRGIPTLCMQFKIEHFVISASQVDCSSKNYIYPPPSGNGRYEWKVTWTFLTTQRTNHPIHLIHQLTHDHAFWRGFTRGRVHASSTGRRQWSGDCYQVHLSNLTELPSSCLQLAPFICQKAAVNCGEVFVLDNGAFISPGYPDPYGAFLNCVWTIDVSLGHIVSLQVVFDIETSHDCRDDFIAVYDGPTATHDLLGKWCGNDNIGVKSNSNQITLTFRTDESVSSKGFIARWTAVYMSSTTTASTVIPTTHNVGGSNNIDKNNDSNEDRTETTDDSIQSVTLYAAISAAAIVFVLILVGIFLVRRYRSRKNERATDDKSGLRVYCTNTSGRLELHVTNGLADSVYDNSDFNGADEADVYNHTDHSQTLNSTPNHEQTMPSDGANIYDHTQIVEQPPNDNHGGSSYNSVSKMELRDNVYNTTTPQNAVNKDDTYNTLGQSFAEDDTYNHTLPRSKTHKDDTYNTFGQSFAEDDTYNNTLLRNNIHKDDTYNTLGQAFADDDTYSHTLQRSKARKDDTYNYPEQFVDVDDTYQNAMLGK